MKETKIIAYKGFDENLCCKGFQYEVGKEYELDGEIECFGNGFHACTNPFDVLIYYDANGRNRFCIVELSGTIKSDKQNRMQASSKIKIIAEIGMDGLFKAGVEWIKKKTNPDTIIKTAAKKGNIEGGDNAKIGSNGDKAKIGLSGDDAKIGSSGDFVQISSSGLRAHIGSSGNYAKIGSSGLHAHIDSSGNHAKIGSIGDCANIGSSGYNAYIGSSGDSAQIGSSCFCAQIGSSGEFAKIGSSSSFARIVSSGDYAQIGLSGLSVNIVSSGYLAQIGSSGEDAKIVSSGNSAKIGSSGNSAWIESTGEDSVICCAGDNSMVRAKKGSWVTLSEWGYSEEQKRHIPVCVKTEFVDGERIKEDTWYKLVNGEFVEQK